MLCMYTCHHALQAIRGEGFDDEFVTELAIVVLLKAVRNTLQ